jgi:hypothetical protein
MLGGSMYQRITRDVTRDLGVGSKEEAIVQVASDTRLKFGCGGRTRTSDHRINNPALYQLSYTTSFGGEGGSVA